MGGCGGSYPVVPSVDAPFSILAAIFCMFSCSLSIDSKSWSITSFRAWSRSVRFLAFFLRTSPMDTSIAHSKCFFNLVYSPQTAPTRPVLWLTPAVNDSTALAMLFTAEPTVSRLRQRSCWRVWEFWIRTSSFALESFNAPIIDVTPMPRAVVEARRLAGSLGSGSWTLNLGDLDRSSSFSSFSAGDLLPSSWWGMPCSSSLSESISTAPVCAGSGGFSERGNAGSAGAAAFAMNLSSLCLRARCTRWERPGPRYSLGILGNFTIRRAPTVHSMPQINHSKENTNSLLLLILRCVTHTLTDDPYSR